MKNELLHIFRNTPFGRETLMQSVYFAKQTAVSLRVYIPAFRQFLMYFENEVVTVDLDRAFLRDPTTAREHAEAVIREGGLEPHFLEPKGFTASTLPDLPVEYAFMCCPRSISDLSTKIGLGHIGPRVRNIIRNASFPILMATPVHKEWRSVTVFFGGSKNAVKALRTGLTVSRTAGCPLFLFTEAGRRPKSHYEKIIEDRGLSGQVQELVTGWLFFEKGEFRNHLYDVPHDSLAVVGAYGHSAIREAAFGSKMETIQTVLPNPMLIVGPRCSPAPGLP